MPTDVIQFSCNHCHTWLTVPGHLAGVVGPCPKCGQQIVSPRAPSAPVQQAFQPAPPPPQQMQPPVVAAPVAPPASWPGLQPQITHSEASPMGATNWMSQPGLPEPPPPGPLFPPAPVSPPAQAVWGSPLPPQQQPDQQPRVLLAPGMPGSTPQNPLGDAAAMAAAVRPDLPTEPSGLTSAMGGFGRPPTVAGSRLSLLARQLSVPADSSQPLPQAPAPLSPEQLRGGAAPESAVPLPDRSTTVQAGQAILQDAIRRGQGVTKASTRKKSSPLLAAAALLFLGAVGYLGWIKREPLKEAIVGWLNEQTGQATLAEPSPAPAEPAKPAPRPGIDPLPQAEDKTTSKPSVAGTTPSISTPPSVAPKAPEVKSVTISDEPPPVPKAEPVPTPLVTQPNVARVETTVATPPRALVVDDEPQAMQPPAPTPAPDVPPAAAPQTSLAMAPALPPAMNENKLVEVGHESPVEMKKTITSAQAKSDPVVGSEGRPKIADVPEGAKEGLDGLQKFLAAPSWAERLKYTMLADQVREKGMIYYKSNSDGPIDVDEIHYLRHDTSPEVGSGTHCVFVLFSRAWEDGQHGIPVMVEVHKGSAQVDWLTFIEFKDNMLRQFMANPSIEGKWRFHVSMRRCHYFDDDVPNASTKDCFEIAPPMPGTTELYAFTDSGSQLSRSIASTITWDKRVTWGIVELQWRHDNGRDWVELTAVPQLNWYSAAAEVDTSRAPTINTGEPVPDARQAVPGSR